MLYNVNLTTALDGRISSEAFSNDIMISSNVAPGAQAIYTWLEGYKDLFKPLFDSRMQIYSATVSPMAVPGTYKRTRNDHVTRYFDEFGTHGVGDEIDPALLTVSAQFFKYATMGTAGAMFIRGVLTEDELKSNNNADPVNQNQGDDGPANARFVTFGSAITPYVNQLGAGRIVLPGPKVTAQGVPLTLAQYEAGARTVAKVEFDGFVQRQLHKATTTIAGKTKQLLRSMVAQLRTAYNTALADADFVAANIPAETTATLNELGRLIYTKFSAAERLALKTEPVLKAYIR
jgi:hypothetical protein